MKSASPTPRASVLRQWLRAPGSLSRRLAALGGRFEVQTLRQGPAPLQRSERAQLGTRARGRSW
ncbi:MAG TPA: chorismate lyase, partial [Albitalea sp.]